MAKLTFVIKDGQSLEFDVHGSSASRAATKLLDQIEGEEKATFLRLNEKSKKVSFVKVEEIVAFSVAGDGEDDEEVPEVKPVEEKKEAKKKK